MTVSRADGKRIVNGKCGNELSSNGNTLVTTIGQDEAFKLVEQMACLEKGVDDYVGVEFNRPQGSVDHVFLDSVSRLQRWNSSAVFLFNSHNMMFKSFGNDPFRRSNFSGEFLSIYKWWAATVSNRVHFQRDGVRHVG